MPWVAGIDGCRAGWFVVFVEYRNGVKAERHAVYPHLRDVIISADPRPEIIAVDIPIGLLEHRVRGGRECDREARRILGRPRRSSVFSPPVRSALSATTYEEAKKLNGGMSRQTFGVLQKIREADLLMNPELQKGVREVHPEVSFWALSGKAMAYGKKAPQGLRERLRVLRQAPRMGFRKIEEARRTFGPPRVAWDDVLDAYAAAWTATRILTRQAKRIPQSQEVDAKELRMEMWY